MSYESYVLSELLPGFLRGRWGERYMRSFAQWTDAQIDKLQEARDVRLLDVAPSDAIPYAARDSNIQRYPLETAPGFLARLKMRWDAWPAAGTRAGLMAQFNAYGITPVLIEPVDTVFGVTSIGTETWSEFWLIFETGTHPWGNDGTWDDPGTWDDGGLWDTDMPYADMLTLTGIAHKWRPAHVVCNLVVIFEGELWDYPVGIWDDGGLWLEGGSALYIRC